MNTHPHGVPIAVFILFAATLAVAEGQREEGPAVVHVYSNRHYDTDRALYEAFEEETGIDVRVVEAGSDEIIQRLAAEGGQSQADLIITADVARLHRAKEMELLQPVASTGLGERVPAVLRDADNHWFALTKPTTRS
ncbi:MAG: extracellular solute-binding protein [Spirochaetota bacterium]